jgi:ubiquinone/menaquinone biosynthesis C-methylase UbiE
MDGVFDKFYREYDSWYDRNNFAFLSEIAAIKKVLPFGRGLEIGVGTGRFAASLGISMGIDPSLNMLDIARDRGVNVRFGYGQDIPFSNEAFDYAALIITLCFVKDPKKVLQEARRVIKPNGTLIVAIVDKKSLLGKFYQRKKSLFYDQANFFNVEEVTALLKKAGFLPHAFYQTLSILPKDMRSPEQPKKGFGKGGFVVISAKKIRNNTL